MPREFDQPTESNMTFGEHLEELRKRILLALIFPLPAFVILFFVSNTIIGWLVLPLSTAMKANGLPLTLQFLGPAEAVVTQLKVSIVGALVLAAPWVLWQAWQFIRPGLYEHERRFVYVLLPGSAILTVIGVALMYFAMLPLMLTVLVGFGSSISLPQPTGPTLDELDMRLQTLLQSSPTIQLRLAPPKEPSPGDVWIIWPNIEKAFAAVESAENGRQTVAVLPLPMTSSSTSEGERPAIRQEYRVSEYISFVLLLFLAIVIAFQMPLVVLLLGWLGIADVRWLRAQRKYALLACGVVSAVITPPDIVSMLVMLLPLYGLYELGILLLSLAPASAVAEGRLRRRGRDA